MTVEELESLPGLRKGEQEVKEKHEEPIQQAEVIMLNEPKPDLELAEETF